MKKVLLLVSAAVIFAGCGGDQPKNFNDLTQGSPFIIGKKDYLNSPMVTAGDRVYMVGHQDGSFPELGWHIKGEMGGIWDHPIKLMDGFEIALTTNNDTLILNQAESFTNYPYANKHNFIWEDQQLIIERWQFVPDGKEGLGIQLLVKNQGSERKIGVSFTAASDLRPTWLGERTNMIDGNDIVIFNEEAQAYIFKDSLNPWFTVFGSNFSSIDHSNGLSDYEGNGITGSIDYSLHLAHNDTGLINFTIAGSYTSETKAWDTYESIQKNIEKDLTSKRLRYESLAQKSRLTIADKEIEQAFEWVKYNCDWLIRTVPEIGTGIGAGIPDYPWWFGVDSEYSLQGYMAVGQTEAVYKTIRLLDSVSNVLNGNGRIIHEMSTNGSVYNKGNINETPQFASLIWKVYRWNGEMEFLQRYFPTVENGLDWLLNENDSNKNGFPDGFGMMEIHGMDSEMIDVAAYSQKAFEDVSKMAMELGKDELSKRYDSIANLLKININEQFWSEEFNSYADFIGTDEQALLLIEAAIVRADTLHKPWAVSELQQTKKYILANPSSKPRPFVLHHNWVVNTPMEMKIASADNAIKALITAEKFVNPFGVFVTGIDRDESAGSDESSFKGSEIFSYTGAVMTLPTGVQIIAENNYGRPDQALNYLKRITRTFSYALPGSIYEVSPDYGMMTQAWNIYGFAVPIVEQFFGIQPDAAHKKVVIAPQMPSEWDDVSLENVQVGNNEISVFFLKEEGQTRVRVTQDKPDWTLEIQLPKRKNTSVDILSEKVKISESETHYIFSTIGSELEVALVD